MAMTEVRRTACSLDCFDACGIVAEVTDGRIVRLGGDPEHPFTRGALCNKVNHYLRDRFYHPDRQLHPLRRVNGGWQLMRPLTSTFRHQNISHASLAAAGGRLWPEGTPRVPWADGRFKTPSGRFVFPPSLDDDPVLPPAAFPLHLIALASERAINSQVPEDHRRHGCVTARVHPAVAKSRGLGDGDLARLVSARGALPVKLECRDDVRPDSVFVVKGDWAKYDRGLNVLTEPRYTAGTGTAYNQNYVRLEPA